MNGGCSSLLSAEQKPTSTSNSLQTYTNINLESLTHSRKINFKCTFNNICALCGGHNHSIAPRVTTDDFLLELRVEEMRSPGLQVYIK